MRENIEKCLNCPYPECCNCASMERRKDEYWEKVRKTLELYESGKTIPQIAAMLGVAKSTVYRHIWRMEEQRK